ncbi:methyltransferase domain-containing protein [Halomonas sp.]|uniref:methyltransferase domain-containing protein n=1 Tax=Halomonas sp. TaxID=1486246 RepID=UPI00384E97D9
MHYEQMFAARGSDYDQAMQAFPDARNAEFQQLLTRGTPKPGEVIADVPAGGGYLKRYLPAGCHYWPHEPCDAFHHGGRGIMAEGIEDPSCAVDQGSSLLPLPWDDASVDLAISLAGVHHLDDKAPLFAELYRVVRPGGRLVLSDVAEGSLQAVFLDEVVGAYNLTGHVGRYLTRNTAAELKAQGWQMVSSEQVACGWQFASRQEAGCFCHRLFGMVKTTPETVEQAVDDWLGLSPQADGRVIMPWALQTLVAVKPD